VSNLTIALYGQFSEVDFQKLEFFNSIGPNRTIAFCLKIQKEDNPVIRFGTLLINSNCEADMVGFTPSIWAVSLHKWVAAGEFRTIAWLVPTKNL